MPNEKKYISSDYLLNILCDEDRYDYLSADDVLDAPTANVSEVKHGEWSVEIGYDPKNKVQCSECKLMTVKPYDYCPHCGARMDGENNGR